ncbi:MAG TPA: acyl carrier protein [Gemmataceae bacterium]|nr:acyl carrier protein [Gemmataceae bacterium]
MSTTEQQVFDLIRETKGVAKVTRSSTWEELNFDSLDQAELVMELESRFHITIPDAEAAFKTVGEAIDYIERAKQKVGV